MPEQVSQNNNNQGNPGKDADSVSAVKSDFFKDDDPDQGSGGDLLAKTSSQDVKTETKGNGKEKQDKDSYKEKYETILEQNKALMESLKEMQSSVLSQQQKQRDAQVKAQEEQNAPKNIFDAVGVEEDDFVFDPDEAVTNPNSDSGKVFRGMMLMTVGPLLEKQKSEIVNQVQQTLQQKEAQQNIANFRSKTGLQDDKIWNKFITDINSTEFTIEDAYKIWAMKNNVPAPNMQQQMNPTMGQMLGGNAFNPNQNMFPQNTNNVRSFGNNGQKKQMSLAEMIGEDY